MYKRLQQEEIERIKCEQQSDRLFINLYSAIGAVGLDTNDITPEEIWHEASAWMHTIANDTSRDFSVKSLHTTLCHKFMDYTDQAGNVQHRTKEQAQGTARLVELVILYQLTVFQRSWVNHPYLNYCLTIYKEVSSSPGLKTIMSKITEANDEYEKIFGSEIPEHDYMPEIVKEDSIIKEACQISNACKQYLANGYDLQWLNGFWAALIQSDCKQQFIADMQSSSRYTTIYRIIGMLLKHGIFLTSQTNISNLSALTNPSKSSIRRYISDGFQGNDKTYDKFVKQYVNEHMKK